jgi:hypothetical protein
VFFRNFARAAHRLAVVPGREFPNCRLMKAQDPFAAAESGLKTSRARGHAPWSKGTRGMRALFLCPMVATRRARPPLPVGEGWGEGSYREMLSS